MAPVDNYHQWLSPWTIAKRLTLWLNDWLFAFTRKRSQNIKKTPQHRHQNVFSNFSLFKWWIINCSVPLGLDAQWLVNTFTFRFIKLSRPISLRFRYFIIICIFLHLLIDFISFIHMYFDSFQKTMNYSDDAAMTCYFFQPTNIPWWC